MIFRQILLQIFHKLQKERTISAAYHLLKGKRSGQTIQDVGLFKLHAFFGILPKLSRQVFDEEIKKLVAENIIHIYEDGYYFLSEQAQQLIERYPIRWFDGWHYRGNEHVFFSRLALVIKSLSYHKEGQMSFSPVVKDEGIQQWVRQLLMTNHYQSGKLQQLFYDEIAQSLEVTAISDEQKLILMKRLSGYGVPGWTWQQLSHALAVEPIDVQLLFIESLHNWLNVIFHASDYPLLKRLSEGVRVEVVLTGSAYQTAQLFKQGYSVEQMSYMRGLKISTIEDHLVELAMNEPNFPIAIFVAQEECRRVHQLVQSLQTKKLKVLHEAVPHLSYFQLRLILAKGGE